MIVVVTDNHQLGRIQVEQMMEKFPNFGLWRCRFLGSGTRYAEIYDGEGSEPLLPVIVDIETDLEDQRFLI